MENLNWPWIKAAMLAIGAAGRNDWRAASVDDIGADPKELRQKLLICLPRAHFEEAGSIETWIEETTALCRAKLAPVLALTESERAFLDGVIERGVIDTSGLDVAEDIQSRIASMPMLNWKADNVRKRGGG